MSEGEQAANVDSIVQRLQKGEYPGHDTLGFTEKIKNDIGSNLSQITTQAQIWEKRGISDEQIDELYKKGFARMTDLYSSDVEKKLLKKVIMQKIDTEKLKAEIYERELGKKYEFRITALFKKYFTELGLEE